MILHILHESNFVKHAINSFEKHFPSKNIFIIGISRREEKNLNYDKNIFEVTLHKREASRLINSLIDKYHVKHIMCHYLTSTKAFLLLNVIRKYEVRTYWIFYGADLYAYLNRYKGYKLYDENGFSHPESVYDKLSRIWWTIKFNKTPKKIYEEAIEKINYFCFWNTKDYELLKSNFKTQCQHKDFIYYSLLPKNIKLATAAKKQFILVNHSASLNGNHKTVLSFLNSIGLPTNHDMILCPLSYGDKQNRDSVERIGKELFNEQFHPLKEYIPANEYYGILNKVGIAFFGHRRQEGGGNIFYLLGIGVKVVLRKENNLFAYLTEKGFKVYSFEDINTPTDISPLSESEAMHNYEIFNKMFCESAEAKVMQKLLN